MATELLATGDDVASSADLLVAEDTTVTVALKGVTGKAPKVLVELKDDAGEYNQVDMIDMSRGDPAIIVITAPGTYRFSRREGTCGVFHA